ncbi:MAG: hypothetical protein WB710_05540 [Stellaceae bacterium]
MRAWPLHLVFGALLIGSLTAQQRTADTLVEIDPGDLAAAVMRVAQSQGLTFLERETAYGNVPALSFAAPGCSGPVVVALQVNFDLAPFAQSSARKQGDVARYVYIDRSWERPNRLAFFIYRMKYAALATFGLTRYVPGGHLMLVDAPPDCQSAAKIDWSDVWNRDYVGAAQADARATK